MTHDSTPRGHKIQTPQAPESPFARPTPKTRQSHIRSSKGNMADENIEVALELDEIREELRSVEIARDETHTNYERTRASLLSLQEAHLRLEERFAEQATVLDSLSEELQRARSQSKLFERDIEQDREVMTQEHSRLCKENEEMTETIARLHSRATSLSPIARKDVERLVDKEDHFTHSRSNSATDLFSLQMSVTSKDRKIAALQDELHMLEVQVQELTEHGEPQIEQLENKIREVESENRALRDDIEGYQTLLQDKTINGEFSTSQFMQSTTSHHKYQSLRGAPAGLDLASELGTDLRPTDAVAQDIKDVERNELEAELLTLQETNKALLLYVNTIVSRMLNTKGFEILLARDVKDIEPPSSMASKPVPEASGPSFLERTKSVLTRKSAQPPEIKQADRHEQLVPKTPKETTARSPGSQTSARSQYAQSDTGYFSSPGQSTEDSATIARRTLSPSKSSTLVRNSKLPTTKGLRPLQSGAAADHITTKEARRLSAQFAPVLPVVQLDNELLEEERVEARAKRSSWLGWLNPKSSEDPAIAGSNGNSRLHGSNDLRSLQEIDAEIERETNATSSSGPSQVGADK